MHSKKVISLILTGILTVGLAMCLVSCGNSSSDTSEVDDSEAQGRMAYVTDLKNTEVYDQGYELTKETYSENMKEMFSRSKTIETEDNTKENALNDTQYYLNLSHISKESLTDILKTQGYSDKNIEYALKQCDVDWNEEALEQAEACLKFASYSYSGLYAQLISDGFTDEETLYAINNCDVDWYAQAVSEARDYINYLDTMERTVTKEIVQKQLEYAQFTDEEVAYAIVKTDEWVG